MKRSISLAFRSFIWLQAVLLTCCAGINHPGALTPSQTRAVEPSTTPILPSPTPVYNTPVPLSSSSPSVTLQTATTPEWIMGQSWPQANQINTMLFAANGDLWAGGPGGLVDWNLKTGKPTTYGYEFKPEIGVRALAQTPDKALWAGTFGEGIFRFDGAQWQKFTTQDGLPTNSIATLFTTSDGVLWVETSPDPPYYQGDLGQFDGNRWIPRTYGGFYSMAAGPNVSIWALPNGPTGLLGYAVRDSLEYYDGTQWSDKLSPKEELYPTAFTVATDGSIWLATRTVLYHYDGHFWHRIIPPWIGKTKDDVSSIAVAQGDTVWFAFSFDVGLFGRDCGDRFPDSEEFGVYRYDGRNWTHFTSKDGLVDDKICDIVIGPDGSIFFGSYDKGISSFDGSKWTSYVVP